jgi:hypothetical protein
MIVYTYIGVHVERNDGTSVCSYLILNYGYTYKMTVYPCKCVHA